MIPNFLRKIRSIRTLYVQILFTVFAFAAMVILSYIFMSSIVRESLLRNVNSTLDFAEERINSSMLEPRTMLEGFSESLHSMVLRGDSPEMLEAYIDEFADYVHLSGRFTAGIKGIFGYFETLPGGPLLIHGRYWNPPEGYLPEAQRWYSLGIEAAGDTAEMVPLINSSKEVIVTFVKCFFDDDGRRLGFACLEVCIDNIAEAVVNTALNRGGHGMLLNQENVVFAHPNKAFVGVALRDPVLPIHIFAKEIEAGRDVREKEMLSYLNEPSVAFFRKLSTNWYLGLVTPKAQYYGGLTNMALVLSLFAAILAAALIGVLVKIDAAKTKADLESRQKSTFLANMSHEIRTPINAVIGMTSIGKSATDAGRKDYCFSKIDDASQHLLGVIADILDMSKIEADKLELSVEEFCFSKIIERVKNVMSFRVEEKRQNFSVSIDEKIPAVLKGDDQRLVQVIINLLSNAVKFTPNSGSISLDAKLLSEENNVCTVAIEISDTGIGIAPEHQIRIFRSFEQVDSGTSRKFGGTGLGLGISKRIVELMGGTIGVRSTPGEGSIFTFSFRAERGSAAAAGEAESGSPEDNFPMPGEFSGCRILLAEDVEINREIILAYFEDTGAEIDCAENGLVVLQKFQDNPGKYDLVFMDVQMPEMDGLVATRRLRELGVTIPIVAMTANVFKEDIEKCLDAGMDDHLGKPLDVNDVIKTVRLCRSDGFVRKI